MANPIIVKLAMGQDTQSNTTDNTRHRPKEMLPTSRRQEQARPREVEKEIRPVAMQVEYVGLSRMDNLAHLEQNVSSRIGLICRRKDKRKKDPKRT